MNVFRAEWSRFFARRFTRVMLLLVVILMAVIAIGTAASSHRPTADDRALARQEMAQEAARQQQDHDTCVAVQNGAADPSGQFTGMPPDGCDTFYGVNQITEAQFLPDVWTFADSARDVIMLFGGLLALIGFAVGASFIGAEWSSGGMMNLLLWRPRRLPVLTAKLTALIASVSAVGVGLFVIWMGMLSAVAATRGEFGHVTSGALQSLGLLTLRSVAIGLAAAVVGFGIASIGRNTVTALGIAIGYVLLIEGAGHIIFGRLFGNGKPELFFLSSYVIAWLQKTNTFYSTTCSMPSTGESTCVDHTWSIQIGHAALTIGILMAVVLVWSFAAFRRRDVT